MKQKNKILIVEDEPVNIAIYQSLLQDSHELFIAETVADTRRLLESQSVDMVLMDVILPDGNGIELCRQLKKEDIFKQVPIIIVTSLDDPENKIKGLEAGANDFLNKPFDRVELQLKVQNHLEIRSLNSKLNDSFENITAINNISTRIMKGFDPRYFDFSRDLFTLLEGYTSQIKKQRELPSFIYIALEKPDRQFQAVMYQLTDSVLTPTGLFTCAWQLPVHQPEETEEDVVFVNREDTDESDHRFQRRFPSEIIERTGPVFNYIGYNGPEVCIAGFNYKKPVNRFMAQTLKSFALSGNFFKVIQDRIGEVKDAHLYTLYSLARAAEASDSDTGAHIARVNHYSGFIAEKISLTDKMVFDISNMAQMHDIGKINIHPDILRKTGRLTPEEWKEMRKHPIYGARILGGSGYMEVARNICLGHHENFNGTGYPMGTKEEEIPIEARIVRLADVYDALRSDRPYKPSFSHEESTHMILNGGEIVKPEFFDPNLLAVFKNHHREFNRIYTKMVEQ
ncbi:MAG: response regulator [bacterium]|nr:response regulator [bacterium]